MRRKDDQLVYWEKDGTARKRGRHKRRYMDAMREDMAVVEVTEEDAEDRSKLLRRPLTREAERKEYVVERFNNWRDKPANPDRVWYCLNEGVQGGEVKLPEGDVLSHYSTELACKTGHKHLRTRILNRTPPQKEHLKNHLKTC